MDQQVEDQGTEAGLTREQLAVLRDKLQAMRAQLLARQSNDEGVVRDDSPMPMEPMEAAERTREQDDALLAMARERALLADVEHALAKMGAGRYGFSESSGRPIGFHRLSAVPWARRTADEEEGL
jgi:DnaK suppressor protein